MLDFADEESVVQTRFATTALVLLLAALGLEIEEAAAQAERVLADGLPAGVETAGSFVFLGRGWTVGLANEAALKLREAALVPAESYPALEYRHGPIALAGEQTVVWALGDIDADLVAGRSRRGCRRRRDRPPSPRRPRPRPARRARARAWRRASTPTIRGT